jgi:hypothetical protein
MVYLGPDISVQLIPGCLFLFTLFLAACSCSPYSWLLVPVRLIPGCDEERHQSSFIHAANALSSRVPVLISSFVLGEPIFILLNDAQS